MVQLDPWPSNRTSQFEYHGIDDNYPLAFDMLDSKQLSEVMEFLNAHYRSVSIITKFLVNTTFLKFSLKTILKTGLIVCLTIIYGFNRCHISRAYAVPSLSNGVAADSIIHVLAEDEVAKLLVQRKKGENIAAMSLKTRPKGLKLS